MTRNFHTVYSYFSDIVVVHYKSSVIYKAMIDYVFTNTMNSCDFFMATIETKEYGEIGNLTEIKHQSKYLSL